MGCLIILLGLIFPRLAILFLFFFTAWFAGTFEGVLIPFLGFLFLPYSLLWYSAVVNLYDGVWGLWQVLIMGLAVLADLASYGRGYRRRPR